MKFGFVKTALCSPSIKVADVNYNANVILENIELVGLCTDICIVSNALILKANFPDAKISVDASCCAGVTVESHNAALLTMKMCQIDIINEVD